MTQSKTFNYLEKPMSTKIDDFKNAVLLQSSVYPGEVDDTNVGTSLDMINADGRCFAVQVIGAVSGTTPSLTGKIQESTDGTTWTDVTNATFTAVTAANNLQVLVFERTKRYLRHARTVSGTSPTFVLNALIGEVKKTI
jgi:hypothetical protein